MKTPSLKALSLENLPPQSRGVLEPLVRQLNQFLPTVSSALQGELTFGDNVAGVVKTLTVTVDATDASPLTVSTLTFADGTTQSTAASAGASSTPDAWHAIGGTGEPAFLNSWTNYVTGGSFPLRFTKDDDGTVHLEGVIQSGSASTAVFTLPTDYRPEYNQEILCNYGSLGIHRIVVDASTGNVSVYNWSGPGISDPVRMYGCWVALGAHS